MIYQVEDEYDVARGIVDAFRRVHAAQRPVDWLGWEVDDESLGEIEVRVEGKRFRLIVEPITEDPHD